ncbi:cobyrinate a,c-diamide synthase [Paenibacillus flagellatus]|uniref:Cobyrinate a,c-diamide synthase n=1 Tax=Paenibacillus flagellatus TaxID=2211139 RepID=A0A2V5KK52_9BACL|nr:cobyrinate a,c-diamide synthase [Paenibacillus flagellatus]PYI55130.1 cobyrinic acid a,c-diamide synthase [Paenibacillus flagellatus]
MNERTNTNNGGSRNRIVVAAVGSGAGKTTVTLGLMAALHRRKMGVQGFKCGPDYIDPTYHTAVTGRESRNLDVWMCGEEAVRSTFAKGSAGADLSIVEGVMGLFDGRDPLSNAGSTADVAALLDAPVLLVVDVQGNARSAAATVLGCQKMDERLRIAGVIANKCGGRGHYELVKAAVGQVCGVPVVGWLGRDERLAIPERHLGLLPAVGRGELVPLFEALADQAEERFDLDAIVRLSGEGGALAWAEGASAGGAESVGGSGTASGTNGPTIAVARDAAFHFYYRDNLELLERLGAKLVYFSPLASETVPEEADGLYIGGGFPEEFAETLSRFETLKADLRRLAERGFPIYAECGGYMFLSESIRDREGRVHPMAGLIPATFEMKDKLTALGYREAVANEPNLLLGRGDAVRGHVFHYSAVSPSVDDFPYAYRTTGLRGESFDGYARGSVLAGYVHVHFASNPEMARRFVERCEAYRRISI